MEAALPHGVLVELRHESRVVWGCGHCSILQIVDGQEVELVRVGNEQSKIHHEARLSIFDRCHRLRTEDHSLEKRLVRTRQLVDELTNRLSALLFPTPAACVSDSDPEC